MPPVPPISKLPEAVDPGVTAVFHASSRRDSRSHAASRVIRRNTNRRHMTGDHHERSAGRATQLVRVVDAILGTHRVTNWVTIALNNRELRRTAAHLIILAGSQNRTGRRLINIALQARGHWLEQLGASQ